MATVESLHPATSGEAIVPGPGRPINPVEPVAFQAAEAGAERLTGLLAFALAVERGEAASPETVTRLRREAEAALCDHAFRYLHNNVEQIRREAVVEHLGRLPRPPGMVRLVSANLLALALAGAAAGWVALHPETLVGLAGHLTG